MDNLVIAKKTHIPYCTLYNYIHKTKTNKFSLCFALVFAFDSSIYFYNQSCKEINQMKGTFVVCASKKNE